MKQFRARARAEEGAYANKQTAEFLLQARSLRQLGEWAAKELMGEGTPGVAMYAEALVRSGIAGSDAFKNVKDDLRLAGHEDRSHEVSSRFQSFVDEARQNARLY